MSITALKRALAATLATAVVLPAGALADVKSASSRGDFTMSLDIVYDGNKPKTIRKFRFDDVIVSCESGPDPNPFTTDSEKPHFGPMGVNGQGRFGRVFTNNGNDFNGKVVIRGEFVTRRKLEGTLKITGDYPNAGYENCGSGKLKWDATVGSG